MSTTIDQKIVEMRFDNAQFERNVQQSINSTNALKESLNFEGAGESMAEITKSAKKVDLSAIEDGLDKLEKHFSASGIMFMTVMSRMTNAAIDAGIAITKALTITPMHSGFEEYELKMGSVQTIMAATGEKIEKVNEYLEELNKYSDQTIYSFSDMTNNIGKFTNAGVKLEDAVAAIKGISNEAAVSGATAAQASHAMYNFAQALSSGYVKLIDWKSIENANMATQEFKQQLIETAVELGKVKKVGDKFQTTTTNAQGKVSDLFNATLGFNDALAHQWMTTDVLTKTLAKYADSTTEIGKKAFASAQDVKTFSMMVDTLKEASQSGWAITSELIFGNLEQAKVLWTNLANTLSEVIEGFDDFRNNILKSANQISFDKDSTLYKYKTQLEAIAKKVGEKPLQLVDWKSMETAGMTTKEFRDELLKAAYDAGTLQKNADGMYETVFKNGDGQEMHQVIETTEDFAKSLEAGWLTMDHVQTAMKKASTIFGMEAFGDSIIGLRDNLISAFANIGKTIGSFVDAITQAFKVVFAGPNANVVEHFANIIREVSNRFRLFTETLLNNKEVMGDVYSIFLAVFSLLKVFINVITAAFKIVKGIFAVVKPFVKIILDVVSTIALFIAVVAMGISQSKIVQNIAGFIAGILERIGKLVTIIFNKLKNSKVLTKFLSLILKLINKIGNALGKINFPSFKGILDWIDKMLDSFANFSLEDTIAGWFNFDLSSGFRGFLDGIKNGFNNFIKGFQNGIWSGLSKVKNLFSNVVFPTLKSGVFKFFSSIDQFLSVIHWDRILNIARIALVATSVSTVVSVFLTLVNTINTFTDAARALANAGVALLQAYTSKIRSEAFSEMIANVQKIGRIIIELGLLSVIIASLPEDTYRKAVYTLEHLIMLVTVCVGAVMTIYYLMKSIQVFSGIQPIDDFASAIAAIGKSFASGFTAALKTWAKNKSLQGLLDSVAVTILALAASIYVLNESFRDLDPGQINGVTAMTQILIPTFIAMGVLMAEMGFISKKMENVSPKVMWTVALSLDAIIAAIGLLAFCLAKLSMSKVENLDAAGKALGGVSSAILIISGAVVIISSKVENSDLANKILLFAGFVTGMAIAIGILATALYVLAQSDPASLEVAANALIGTIIAMTASILILLVVFDKMQDSFTNLGKTADLLSNTLAMAGLATLLVGFALAVAAISSAITKMSNEVDPAGLDRALTLLIAVEASILGFMVVAGGIMQKFDLSTNLFKLAAAIGGFTLAILGFSNFNPEQLIKGVGAIVGLMVGVGTAVRIAGGQESVKGATKFALAVTALSGGVWVLSKIPVGQAMIAIGETVTLLYFFSKATSAAAKMSVKPLVAFFGGFLLVIGTLYAVAHFSSSKEIKMVYAYVGALSLLIISLGILASSAKRMRKAKETFLGMAAAFAGFGVLIAALAGAAALTNSVPGGLKGLVPLILIAMGLSAWLTAMALLVNNATLFNATQASKTFLGFGVLMASFGVALISVAGAAKLAQGNLRTIYLLIPVVAALGALAVGFSYLLARHDFNNTNSMKSMMKSLATLITSITTLLAVITGVSWLVKGDKELQKTMAVITGIVVLIGGAMGYIITAVGKLENLNTKSLAFLGVSLFSFIGVMMAVLAAAKVITDFGISKKALVTIGGVTAGVSFVIVKMAEMIGNLPQVEKKKKHTNNIMAVVATSIAIMGALVGASILVTKFSSIKSLIAVTAATLAFFYALMPLLKIIHELPRVATKTMFQQLGFITILALAMAGVMAAFALVAKLANGNILNMAGVIAIATAFFYALTPLIEILSGVGELMKVGWSDALIGLAAVSILAVAISGVILAVNAIVPKNVDLVNLMGTLAIATAFFYALTPLVLAVTVVGAVLALVGGVAAIIGLIAGIAAIGALAISMAWIMKQVSGIITGIDAGGLAKFCASAVIFMLAFTALLGVVVIAGLLAIPATGAAIALGICLAAFALVLSGLNLMKPLLIKAFDTLGILAEGFSMAFEKLTSHLGGIGKNLSDFAVNATPFFTMLAKLNENALTGAGMMADVMLKLTAVGWANILGINWIGVISASAQLVYFAKSMNDFSAAVSQLKNWDEMEKATTCIANIMAAAHNIPNSGGLVSLFTGNNDIDKFGEMLAEFGKHLAAFHGKVSGITDWTPVTSAVTAMNDIFEAAHNIPNNGGVVSWFTGNNDLGEFAQKLSNFGKHLVIFYNQVASVTDWSPVTLATTAMADVFKAAKQVPRDANSIIGAITGMSDIGEFAGKLTAFGEAMVNFDDIELNINNISNTLDAMTFVFGKTKWIDKSDSALFTMSPENFYLMSSNAEAMGYMLNTLASSLTITPEQVNTIKYATSAFAELFNISFDIDTYLRNTKLNVEVAATKIIKGFKNALGISMGSSEKMTQANTDFWNGWFHTDLDNCATAALAAYKAGLDIVAGFRNGIDAHSDARTTILANEDFWNGWDHENARRTSFINRQAKEDGVNIVNSTVEGIQNGSPKLTNATEQTAVEALDAFFAKVESGEIKLEEVGKNSGEAVVKGLDEGTKEASENSTVDTTLVETISDASVNSIAAADQAGRDTANAYYDAVDDVTAQRSGSIDNMMLLSSNSAARNRAEKSKEVYGPQKPIKVEQQLNGTALNEMQKAKRTNEQKKEAAKLATKELGTSKDIGKATSMIRTELERITDLTARVKAGDVSLMDALNDEWAHLGELKNQFTAGTLAAGLLNLKEMGIDIDGIKSAIGIDTSVLDSVLGTDESAASDTKSKVESQINDINKIFENYWSSVNSKRSGFMKEGNLFSAVDWGFDPENPVTKETLKKNLEDQIAQLSRFNNVQVELASRISNDGLRYAIQEMGVDSLEELEALSMMTDAELAEYEKLYEAKFDLATKTADTVSQNARDTLAGSLNAALGTSFGGLDSNEAVAQLESFWDGTEAGLNKLIEADAAGIGHGFISTVAEGMTDDEAKVIVETLGKGVTEAIANGMTTDEAIQTLRDAGYTLTEDMEKSLRETVESSETDAMKEALGKGVAEGMAQGMTCDEAIQTLRDAGFTISDDIETYLREALDINSPSKRIRDNVGAYVNEAIVPTDNEAAENIRNAVTMVTAWIVNQFREKVDIFKGIGEFINNAIIEGMTANTASAVSNMETVADAATNALNKKTVSPTITPVYNSKSLDDYNSLMSNSFAQKTLALANQANASMSMDVNKTIKVDNTAIVAAINKLDADLFTVSERVGNLQVMLDSGALVGQIAPQMNSALGMTALRTGRYGG